MIEVVEEIQFVDPKCKAEIRRRADGHLQVHLFAWRDEDVAVYGRVASDWSEVHTAVTLVDTLEAGRKIAGELLRNLGATEPRR